MRDWTLTSKINSEALNLQGWDNVAELHSAVLRGFRFDIGERFKDIMAFLPTPRGAFLLTRTRYCAPCRIAARPRHITFRPRFMQTRTPAASLAADARVDTGNSKGTSMASTPLASRPELPTSLSDGEMATRYDPQALEATLYEWWEQCCYFAPESTNPKANENPFVVCMPPPNVTGDLHMGHAMFVAVEDILARRARMQGRPVLYLPGKDHAGIATQLVVAKQLADEGINYKELPRDEFVDRIWDWKHRKHDYISNQLRRLGASCDWNRERFTLDDAMCRAVNEAFVTLHERGLVYRGEYLVNWAPGLQTAVSDIEVEFKEENGKLYYFRYPVDGGDSIPVATTRPETILGDTAVCVHPEDERYAQFIGKNAHVPGVGRAIPIIADEYVDREFGTGALKITPGHDTNDYEIGKRHNLDIINIMNRDATLNENAGDFAGLDRFVARKKVWQMLEEQGFAVEVKDHVSRVPRSQRGGEIVEPLVSTQWFVKMEGMAKRATDAVRDGSVKIVPERFEKIYYNWLADIKDWCVSRQLVWGHRIPVWYVIGQPGEYIVARNEDEARTKAVAKYGDDVQLEQDGDVLDTWFSSGLWPFATMGWPKDTSDLERFFPGSVLETGYDILFFWVARMVMMSLELTGKAPFHTVYLHGLVNDAHGKKMSKSVGNVIDPLDTIASYGTDALRYSLVTGATPGQDIPLSVERIESNRNFANKLWNAARFIVGNLSDADEAERLQLARAATTEWDPQDFASFRLPERAIVSGTHALVTSVNKSLDEYAFADAGSRIYEFLWDEFAAWYVEIAKQRLYGEASELERRNTRRTLVYVLDTCLRLLHPFMPFVTEAVWQRLPRDSSVEHALIMAQWPAAATRDESAENAFARVQALVRSVRNVRAEYDVANGVLLPVLIHTDEETAREINAESNAIALLSKIDLNQMNVTTDPPQADDESLLVNIAENLTAVIPLNELIDYEKERQRLERQITKLTKDRDGLASRLNAPGFADKAPPNVVAETKERKAVLDDRLQALNERLDVVLSMVAN